jgi:hypothetical protein
MAKKKTGNKRKGGRGASRKDKSSKVKKLIKLFLTGKKKKKKR